MSDKVKKVFTGLAGVLAALAAFVVIGLLLRMILNAIAESRAETAQLRSETDKKFAQLRNETVSTLKAVREENRKVAREIVDEVRAKTAKQVGTIPKGPAGFAGANPEPIV